MNIVIRKINDDQFLLITLNENLTVDCKVDTISNLISFIRFSENNDYYCDERTLSILDQNMILPANIEVVFNIHQNICNYLYDNVYAYANLSNNREFYNLIKKYLVGNNKKRGSTGIEKRKRPIFTELLDSTEFINDFSNLWFSFTGNSTLNYTKKEENAFIEKIASLINEISTATDIEVKKNKQIELDRHYRSEKQLKNHIFKISR